MSKIFKVLLFVLIALEGFTQEYAKSTSAYRITVPPKIDGQINDEAWKNQNPISDFTQYEPVYNIAPTQKSNVWIAYDNYAIYIAAMLYDSYPDSILRQLGNRDDEDLNADEFGIELDPYNNFLDAYTFSVSASGVQSDSRVNDASFDGVWQSAVRITSEGWCVEMKIPYSAIRFPVDESQLWRMEIYRKIRRNRELDQWALELKEADNKMMYWGVLKGIEHIKAPLRLSLTPYVGFAMDHYPENIEGKSNFSYLYSGGLDLKYGINESFTLDMTLLPDFSQVQSDNLVKNLTPYETQYVENRPFFNEAVDLFKKGGLFYSRRIGSTTYDYYSVSDSLKQGEYIFSNPETARLLNALKISGRSKNGLAAGFFNAIVNEMYATIKDSATSQERKILTQPLTNYNLIVFDQALKNGSSVTILNSNVMRDKGYDDANVTGAMVALIDKKNTYRLKLNGFLSQLYHKTEATGNVYGTTLGYRYNLNLSKINGNFRFNIKRELFNNTYDDNDMSVSEKNNFILNLLELNYNIYKPFSIFRDIENLFSVEHTQDYLSNMTSELQFNLQTKGTFMNYLSFWAGLYASPLHAKDFYEPRVAGRYIEYPEYGGGYIGFSSDYRKPFALDGEFYVTLAPEYDFEEYEWWIRPIVRVSDKLAFWYMLQYTSSINSLGYVDQDTANNIIIGKRDVFEIDNSTNARYLFKNNLSLNLRLRHYWSEGTYKDYYTLMQNGLLEQNDIFSGEYDHNFNTFYLELYFLWEFAPGSTISIMWKNNITGEDQEVNHGYFKNLDHTFSLPQSNMISLRVLYYFDFQYLNRKNKM